MNTKLFPLLFSLIILMFPGLVAAEAFNSVDKIHINPGDHSQYWPIYVYAVGDLVKEVLEVTAILVSSSAFITFNVVVLLVGLLLMGAKSSVHFDAKVIGGFFLGAVFFSYATVWSKADVVVYDQYNHSGGAGYYVVNDVPAIIAVPVAGITSGIHSLQEVMATTFSLPNSAMNYEDLSVAKVGFNLLGTVVKDSTNITITNSNIKGSFEEFYMQCTMYDIYNGTLSPAALMNSSDLISAMATTNETRLTKYYDPATGAISMLTCKESYEALSALVQSATGNPEEWANQSMPSIGMMSNVGMTATSAIQAAYAALGTTGSGANIAVQHALVNTIGGAYAQAATITGTNDLALAINTEQAKQSQITGWITAAEVFADMGIYLLGGLQALVFAMLPIALAFIAVPGMGMKMIASAFKIVLWLALWPLGLEVINFLAIHVQTNQLSATTDINGATMATIVGMRESSAKLTMVFSLIGTLMPMLLYSLINSGEFSMTEAISKGMGSDSGKAAGAAAAKGDVAYDNVKTDSVSSNKYDTALSHMTGIAAGSHAIGAGTGIASREHFTRSNVERIDGSDWKTQLKSGYGEAVESARSIVKSLAASETRTLGDAYSVSKDAAGQWADSEKKGYSTAFSEGHGAVAEKVRQSVQSISKTLDAVSSDGYQVRDSETIHGMIKASANSLTSGFLAGGKAASKWLGKNLDETKATLRKDANFKDYTDEELDVIARGMTTAKANGQGKDLSQSKDFRAAMDTANASKISRGLTRAQYEKNFKGRGYNAEDSKKLAKIFAGDELRDLGSVSNAGLKKAGLTGQDIKDLKAGKLTNADVFKKMSDKHKKETGKDDLVDDKSNALLNTLAVASTALMFAGPVGALAGGAIKLGMGARALMLTRATWMAKNNKGVGQKIRDLGNLGGKRGKAISSSLLVGGALGTALLDGLSMEGGVKSESGKTHSNDSKHSEGVAYGDNMQDSLGIRNTEEKKLTVQEQVGAEESFVKSLGYKMNSTQQNVFQRSKAIAQQKQKAISERDSLQEIYSSDLSTYGSTNQLKNRVGRLNEMKDRAAEFTASAGNYSGDLNAAGKDVDTAVGGMGQRSAGINSEFLERMKDRLDGEGMDMLIANLNGDTKVFDQKVVADKLKSAGIWEEAQKQRLKNGQSVNEAINFVAGEGNKAEDWNQEKRSMFEDAVVGGAEMMKDIVSSDGAITTGALGKLKGKLYDKNIAGIDSKTGEVSDGNFAFKKDGQNYYMLNSGDGQGQLAKYNADTQTFERMSKAEQVSTGKAMLGSTSAGSVEGAEVRKELSNDNFKFKSEVFGNVKDVQAGHSGMDNSGASVAAQGEVVNGMDRNGVPTQGSYAFRGDSGNDYYVTQGGNVSTYDQRTGRFTEVTTSDVKRDLEDYISHHGGNWRNSAGAERIQEIADRENIDLNSLKK